MADATSFAQALKRNAAAYDALLPELLETDPGRSALIREGRLVRLFDTLADAAGYARVEYPDGLYMTRRITGARSGAP